MFNFTMGDNGTANYQNYPTYALVFGSVMVLGLPLNAVSLWILVRRHNLKSPSAVFMINLAISDLLLVISLPTRVYFYATNSWPLGSMTCIWITMLFCNNIRSSSIFITFISMDRLLAVVYPLRSRHLRTTSNASKAAALIWFCVLVWNIPESVMFSRFLNKPNVTTCFEFSERPSFEIVSFFQPVLVFTMLAVNIVSTALVSWTLTRHLNDSARVSNKVNVMLIFAMNLLMFTIFFLPVSLVDVLESSGQVITSLKCLASVNCCLDPLLYYFSFDGFWKKKEDIDTSDNIKPVTQNLNLT
ncbi:lysophosphatidic acid receptor 6-like [Anabas testudineus]|uniref:G-protein coupled receptors family 1 profile domain-containing protein n=1 Tax=Anabas testudineus TaxID=64144 RepID=A0A3Q1KBA9_ANATE|nr:lysophosphatidic acid receptor 6-like [Anabas testudineus]